MQQAQENKWVQFIERTQKEVTLGNLYLYEPFVTRRIPFYYPPAEVRHSLIPHDKNSGNIHMIPSDINFAMLCSSVIFEKGISIFKYIKNKLKDNEEIKNTQSTFPFARMLSKTDYKYAKYLFSYISVASKSKKYDLMFNRFFIENNQVNCILLCFQIKMYNKESEPKSIENYPDKSFDKNGENSIYYNFNMDIHSSAEDIAERFLEFVYNKEREK